MFSRRKAARIAPYVVVLGIAALLYRSASGIDFFAPGGRIGPDFWPKMVLILMIATCVYEIVKIGLFSSDESVSGVLQTLSASPPAAERRPAGGGRRPDLPAAAGARASGPPCSTRPWCRSRASSSPPFAYLVAFIGLGRYRRMGVAIGVSLVGTLLMLFFFMKVAYISLPIGTAPFSAVSLFLMQVMGIR